MRMRKRGELCTSENLTTLTHWVFAKPLFAMVEKVLLDPLPFEYLDEKEDL